MAPRWAAAIEATQSTTGRPLRWATAQFASHVRQCGRSSTSTYRSRWSGRHLSQARAIMRCDGSEILTMLAALGERPFPHHGVWPDPPVVPASRGVPRTRWYPGRSTHSMLETFDRRSAIGRSYNEVDGHPGPGRSASWFRLPGGRRDVSAGDLAVLGDFLMLEFADALGVACTGASLDNTVRVANLGATEWVLLDASIHAVDGRTRLRSRPTCGRARAAYSARRRRRSSSGPSLPMVRCRRGGGGGSSAIESPESDQSGD